LTVNDLVCEILDLGPAKGKISLNSIPDSLLSKFKIDVFDYLEIIKELDEVDTAEDSMILDFISDSPVKKIEKKYWWCFPPFEKPEIHAKIALEKYKEKTVENSGVLLPL
jgi:hypothetical protein